MPIVNLGAEAQSGGGFRGWKNCQSLLLWKR